MSAPDTEESFSRQTVASAFVVRDDLVVSVARYPDLARALRVSDLDESHVAPVDHRAGARGSGGGEVGKS